jgi:hypothetical protein
MDSRIETSSSISSAFIMDRSSVGTEQFAEKVSRGVILNGVTELKLLESKIIRGAYPELKE